VAVSVGAAVGLAALAGGCRVAGAPAGDGDFSG